MADIISRLKLESGEFDSKIKRAGQELMAYSEHCRKTGLEMGYANRDAKDFAKALGDMQTTSTTARGKISELSDAFVNLRVMYKNMTDEEKNNQFGKNLAASLDQLKTRIQDAKRDLADVTAELNGAGKASGGGIFSGLGSKMEGALAVFGGNLMTKAAGAVANLGQEMYGMVQQGIEMAKQGEGIRIAFERLGRGDILDGLREATHGTVTDLELMKAAVKFNDFKLPLDELGTMLAFAQQKAKDTGQSVDYMVDSIVTGLGRKSLMILDNLGLSATEIRERMKETGDMTKAVGSIIRDQMAAAGEYVETAADRAAQANVSLQNKMEELGRKFIPLEQASTNFWTSMKIGILDVVGGPLTRLLNGLTEAGRLMNQQMDVDAAKTRLGGSDGNKRVDRMIAQLGDGKGSGAYQTYKNQLASFDKYIAQKRFSISAWSGDNSAIVKQNRQRLQNDLDAALQMRAEYVKKAQELHKKATADIVDSNKGEIQSVASLKKELKDLEEQRRKAVKSGDQELVETLTKQISQTKTNLGYLDPNAVKTGGSKTSIQYASDSIMAQEKLISDLTKKWKTASGELRDGYLKDLDAAKAKLKEMTAVDNLPTFTMAELEGTRPKSIDLRGNEGKAQDKLDLATAAFATSGTSNVDFSNYTSALQNAIKDANIGSELYTQLTEQLRDTTTVSTLLQELMERGMAGTDLESTAQALKDKLLSPEGIDQEAVQAWLEQLNKQIEEAGGVGLKLNSETGEVSDDKKKNDADLTTAINKATVGINALSNINSGLKGMGIDLGEDIGNAISFIQSLMTVIQGVHAIVSLFQTPAIVTNTFALETLTATLIAKSFLPGFANGGIVPAFAHGGLIGRAAAGIMIPGNSMSGDRLRLPVDGGRGMIGVNSGELILNRAQQGVIAQELEGGGFDSIQLEAVIGAEEIMLVTNNRGSRTQRGEYVQSNNRRG